MNVEDVISSAYKRAKKSVRISLYAKMEESSGVYSARASLEGNFGYHFWWYIHHLSHKRRGKRYDGSARYGDMVISLVWNWIYTPEVLNQTADTDALIELLRNEYGSDAVEDNGIVDGFQRYEIMFSNVRFYIVQLPRSYRIGAALPVTNAVYVSCCNPQETLSYMREFNELIPTVHDYIEQNVSLLAKDNMISDVTAATGKGIIDQLIAEEGLDVPPISSICGTANGRVKVYFADSAEKINCPLDYLRARFLRRFGKRKTK